MWRSHFFLLLYSLPLLHFSPLLSHWQWVPVMLTVILQETILSKDYFTKKIFFCHLFLAWRGIKSETSDPDITHSLLQYPDMRRPYSLWKTGQLIYMSVTKFAKDNDQVDVPSVVYLQMTAICIILKSFTLRHFIRMSINHFWMYIALFFVIQFYYAETLILGHVVTKGQSAHITNCCCCCCFPAQ